ncbi:sigma-54-dependent Fis family transcriptional regulator [candidate division KSB1 bacterium 4572_119]|nr:MAG: sigma-54-dependent Fis family transcriptional regulator [candidate division KSB1 bacterium 4572_119]
MKQNYGKILIIDDDVDVLQAARLFLKQHVEFIHTESDPNTIPSLLKNENYDVILLDMNFAGDVTSGKEGFFWLNKIMEIDPSSIVVLITAYGDVEMSVKAMKEGANDFILKPWQNEKLLATINSALNLKRSRAEVDSLKKRQQQLIDDLDKPFKDFVGASDEMQKVFDTISKVAQTEANILILGENGTGKELVARELHRQSLRANEVFINVDMGAISDTLFESELFGHKKGAFTDAKEDRAGRFEIASGGSLFLDEIGNLTLPLQAKLLTTLQNREIFRLGSNNPIPINVRLISATNRSINEMVHNKEFRQDLLYRINTVEIHLPPLRERLADIPLLVDHFLGIYCKKYNVPLKRLNATTHSKLEKYSWPGNVRELQHAIERAVIMTEATVLQPSDIFLSTREFREDGLIFDNYNLEEAEKLIIRKALGKHSGNISKAARELGLTRTSLYRRLEKYGI